MASHHEWEARVINEHDLEKPFAPENGQPLKFKIGDPVIYKNSYGVTFKRRVTGFYRPEVPSASYALGRRYFIDSSCYWMPVSEASLSLDPERNAVQQIESITETLN